MFVLKRKILFAVLLLAVAQLFAAPPKNKARVKESISSFFVQNKQSYSQISDDDNDDLYFIGNKDLFLYPTFYGTLEYEHYSFEKKLSAKDFDSVPITGMSLRFCSDSSGKSYTIWFADKKIFVMQPDKSYVKYSFVKKCTASN